MLRKFLDYQLSLSEEGKPLHFFRPLITAGDTFLYEPAINTSQRPHIRDAVDVKRWMILVVFALIPCFLWSIWNTGLQSFVYGSGDFRLMNEYLSSAASISSYFEFAAKNDRWMTILSHGLYAVLPIVLISYAVGGAVEAFFALIRRHEITEGFLVTGILYALILPSTIPYWMTAVGVALGVILGKEVFGGSGMNIVNPALACRAFLFFTFPGRMTGNVWAGTNPKVVRDSLVKMNMDAGKGPLDGYSQATWLGKFNVPAEIKRVHVDAIATNDLGTNVPTIDTIQRHFEKWSEAGAKLGELTQEQMRSFVTSPIAEGGLGLSPGYYEDAYHFSGLNFGIGHAGDWNFFFGDRLGSMGSTSILFCLLGAVFLIWTGVGRWRPMVATLLGAWVFGLLFNFGSSFIGIDSGAWNPAQYSFPAYKHLLLGGLAFGAIFMATDPVTHPVMKLGQWMFGLMCGAVTILIRVVNPAFPEGVMLAILMGNVFAPLFDYYSAKFYRKRSVSRVRARA